MTKEAYPDDNPKTKFGVTKPSITKVPASAMFYCAMAMMDGGRKYGPYNWREKDVTASIYIDAAWRHLMSWFDGREELAKDSKVHHLGHAMACICIIIDAMENGCLNDDRPINGDVAGLIERLTNPLPNIPTAAETPVSNVSILEVSNVNKVDSNR